MNAFTESVAIPEPVAAPRERPADARDLAALRVPTWAGLLLVAALWLIVRPYRGVRHDGILYLGQTLARLMPDSIGRDLFLAYGSQDRYSIFSPIMAPLVARFGVGSSQIGVLFLCEAIFILGCWRLTAELPSRFLRWCSMLSLVSMAHTYGGGGAFAFAEPFLSARSMAEPCVVLALALLLRGRLALGALSMLLAVLIHPLIALPGLTVAWVYLVSRDRRWRWALAAVAVFCAAGALGVAPFDALWRRFDPAWWAAVQYANKNAFLASQGVLDWVPTIFDAGVLLIACRLLAATSLSRLIKATLCCAAAFTLAWGVGADLLHDVLLTQLQLWRIFWLVHLLAVLVLPVLLVDLWGRGAPGRWAAAGVALAALAVTANLSTGWLCVVWAGFALLVLRSRAPVSGTVARLATMASVLGMVVVSAMVCRATLGVVSAFTDRFNGASVVQVVFGLSVCCAGVGFVLLRGLGAESARWRGVSIAAVLLLAVGGLSCWDQRSDWQRFLENGLQASMPPFADQMPAAADVYWDGSLAEPWLLIHRPQYLAPEQASGLLFNRQTSMAFMERRRVMAPLDVQKQICETVAGFTGADVTDLETCSPRVEDIKAFCRTPGRPDILVFRSNPGSGPAGATATWTFAPGDPARARSYRLYDCAKLK